jgi:trans-aconitate methyltransferase
VKVAGGANWSALDLALQLLSGSTAAEVGAGSGRLLGLLEARGFVVYACESDPELAAQTGADVADAREWAPPEPVDVVTCIELIEHLRADDHSAFVDRMVSWLKPGGQLVVSTPQARSPVSVFERIVARLRPHLGAYEWWDPTHVSVRPRSYWLALFRSHALEVEREIGWCYAPELLARRVPSLGRAQTWATAGFFARFGFDLTWVLRPGAAS